MQRACKYCGRYHRRGEGCGSLKHSEIKKDERYYFRNSSEWRHKREEIRERDLNMCVACLHGLPMTVRRYNSELLEVHHIEPLEAAHDKRLDDDNLVTLCSTHHKLADRDASFNDLIKMIVKGYNL